MSYGWAAQPVVRLDCHRVGVDEGQVELIQYQIRIAEMSTATVQLVQNRIRGSYSYFIVVE